MFDRLRYIFDISRFRFWIYTGGTFVVGYTLGADRMADFYSFEYYVYLFYFFFLANVFIYGVNDLFDISTDRKNPKKEEKEHRLLTDEISDLKRILLSIFLISTFLLFFQESWIQRFVFSTFLFLSYFYSAEPLRFKSKPFLDFSSNMLYIMPGIFGYVLVTSELPPLLFVIAGFTHIAAMHVFSAVPDIDYDQKAAIKTTAVVMGKKASLVLCTIFWSGLASVVIFLSELHPLSFIVLIYPVVPLLVLFSQKIGLEKVYWTLPYINTSMGGLLFALLLYTNIL